MSRQQSSEKLFLAHFRYDDIDVFRNGNFLVRPFITLFKKKQSRYG